MPSKDEAVNSQEKALQLLHCRFYPVVAHKCLNRQADRKWVLKKRISKANVYSYI